MSEERKRCPSCMSWLADGAELCEHCGQPCSVENGLDQLPVGTVLAGRYQVGRSIGSGGFGVTYIGWDTKLDMVVAIKEYYPAEISRRYHTQSLEVRTESERTEGVYRKQKAHFLDEARTLAKFSEERSIVGVRDLFEENNTAYIVMEYLRGRSMKQFLEEKGPMSFDQAVNMLLPVMDGLNKVHQAGLIHRDISPSNLMVLEDGSVKLLDFGTAREFDMDDEKSRSIILKPGFSPEEQYRSHGEQGPWTDVYALCATIYKMITGQTPENSMNRLFEDTLIRPSDCGAVITPAQEQVLLKGMSVRRQDRYQSISEWKDAALGAGKETAPVSVPEDDEVTLLAPPEAADEKTVPAQELPPTPAETLKPVKQEKPPKQPAPAPKGKKSAHKTSRQSGEKKGGIAGKVIGGVAVGAAVIGLSVGMMSRNPYRDGDSFASYLSDETVTGQMIRALKRDKGTTQANFYNCELSDDIIAELAEIDHIEEITMDECTGYTTLEALAGMEGLTGLEVSGDDSEDLFFLEEDKLFPCEFPNITKLDLSAYQMKDDSELFEKFPNLEILHLFNMENVSLDSLSENMDVFSLYHSTMADGGYSGLSNCTKMTDVMITDTEAGDLSWAQNMTLLEDLEIANEDNPAIKDLTALKNHEALEWLYLNNCHITDLAPLSSCSALQQVKLDNNQITDLNGIELCEELDTLHVGNNQVTDISALATCVNLQSLNLADNQITDISSLANCDQLTWLALNDNPFGDASSLSDCIKMRYLYLNRTGVSNLDFCTAMIDLEQFYARENQITQLDGLINTTQLTHVALNDNQITDLSPLSKNAATLEFAYLHNNQLTDLSPLSGFANLDVLTLDGNQLTSLHGLEDSGELRYLVAGYNQLTDISALASCENLGYLDLGHNQITDISALSTCSPSAQVLLLDHNQLTSIASLESETDYKGLVLYENPIRDLHLLQGLQNINPIWDVLYLSWDETFDIKPIAMSGYEKINVVGVPLDLQANMKNDYRTAKKSIGAEFPALPSFISVEQADEDLAAVRTKARENEENIGAGVDAYDYFTGPAPA